MQSQEPEDPFVSAIYDYLTAMDRSVDRMRFQTLPLEVVRDNGYIYIYNDWRSGTYLESTVRSQLDDAGVQTRSGQRDGRVCLKVDVPIAAEPYLVDRLKARISVCVAITTTDREVPENHISDITSKDRITPDSGLLDIIGPICPN